MRNAPPTPLKSDTTNIGQRMGCRPLFWRALVSEWPDQLNPALRAAAPPVSDASEQVTMSSYSHRMSVWMTGPKHSSI